MCAALVLLTACSDEEVLSPTYTVGEAVNAITLSAGIREGGSEVQTRAGSDDVYVPFSAVTKLRLRVDGTWTGHDPESVSKMTSASTATFASEMIDGDKNDKHAVEFTSSEALYWDDYGTADPANESTGRTTGLTIYGVAVEGKSSLPASTPADLTSNSLSWTELSWNVGAVSESKINQKGGWGDYDLITSNNIRSTSGGEGTYKFEHYIHDLKNPSEPKQSINLLKFTHAMTKITVNLTAGEGFPGFDTGATNAKFENAPEVTLLGFNYTGTVSVEAKTSTPTSASTTNIEAWRDNGATWPDEGKRTSQFTALVFPGNEFSATIADDADKTPTSSTNILKLNADDNVYYVTAAQLVKAIAKKDNNNVEPVAGNYEKTLAQGVNYILNIKVNKTKIIVEATIKRWDDINAEEVTPVINITANYGESVADDNAFNKSFDLFRSTTIDKNYDDKATLDGINYASRYTYSGSAGSWSNVIFWPNHSTHYFFRGVYPTTGTNSVGLSSPIALAVTKNTSDQEVIAVENVTYDDETWPSDLMIALPRTTNDPCTNHNKTPLENGICATTGTITMNFEYAMSKVEVRLKSSESTASDYVNLNNIQVDIVGGYNKGRISLKDGLHDDYSESDKGDYTLHQLSPSVSGFTQTTQDAIIPQELSDAAKLKITVTNGDGTTDVYYAQLNQIIGKKAGADDSTKAKITEWEHGEYYIYELKVTKTQVHATATLTDWTTVTTEENVWF